MHTYCMQRPVNIKFNVNCFCCAVIGRHCQQEPETNVRKRERLFLKCCPEQQSDSPVQVSTPSLLSPSPVHVMVNNPQL